VRCTSTGGFVADFQSWRYLEFDGEATVKGDGDVVGIYLSNSTTSNEVIGCKIHGMRANYVANGGAAARKAQGVYIDPNANNNVVWGCRIYDIGALLGTIANQEHGVYCSGDNVKIVGNLIYKIANGYGVQVYDGGALVTGVLVAANTIVMSTASGKSCIVINGNGVNNTVKNNVLKNAKEFGVEWFPAASGTGSGNVMDRNVTHGCLLGTHGDSGVFRASATGWAITNEFTGDPLFVNAAGDDYHIGAGSSADGVADRAYLPATDLDGVARVGDAGAFELP
jgi:hypothetical protein